MTVSVHVEQDTILSTAAAELMGRPRMEVTARGSSPVLASGLIARYRQLNNIIYIRLLKALCQTAQ